MKNRILLLILSAATGSISSIAQDGSSQRLVLCEGFAGEDCPPCFFFEPGLDSLLNANASKVVTIKYFLNYNWGNSGLSPFYYDNTVDVDARNAYYSCYAIPEGYMDGENSYDGSNYPLALVQSEIDDRYAIGSPFVVNVTHSISTDIDSVYSTIVIKASDAINSNFLKARVAVIERVLNFPEPPGTNGETHFEGMMKKMLPDAGGTVLPSSWAPGDSVVLNLNWEFYANMYDISQVAIVAFVQNDSTKEVLQSGYSAPLPTVGITEADIEDGILVYPNPFTSHVAVRMNSEKGNHTSIVICNSLGEIIFAQEDAYGDSSQDSVIDMSSLPNGIYMIQVISDGKKATRKLVKQ